MNFGINTNVQVEGTLYHVQTEDYGASQPPYVETTVYLGGRVLHRKTASYQELVGDGEVDRVVARQLVQRQHGSVLEELRNGRLKFEAYSAPTGVAPRPGIRVELLNPISWLGGNQARLRIAVQREGDKSAVEDAAVGVDLEGAATPLRLETRSDGNGRAELSFSMPPLTPEGGTLVIRAEKKGLQAELRFRLRSRSATPVTPKPA